MTVGKTAAALVVAAAVWLTANLGQAWWVLLILLAIDAVLNYRDEVAYWRRVLSFLGSTAAALYIQHGSGIPFVHAVILALVAWEAVRVGDQVLSILARRGGAAVPAAAARDAVQALEARVEAIAARMPADAPPAKAGAAAPAAAPPPTKEVSG